MPAFTKSEHRSWIFLIYLGPVLWGLALVAHAFGRATGHVQTEAIVSPSFFLWVAAHTAVWWYANVIRDYFSADSAWCDLVEALGISLMALVPIVATTATITVWLASFPAEWEAVIGALAAGAAIMAADEYRRRSLCRLVGRLT